MDCNVTIFTAKSLLTPETLLKSAIGSSVLELDIVNQHGHSITIPFVPNRDTIDNVLAKSNSTSSLVTHCHFHGLFEGFLSAISICNVNEINGLIITKDNFFALGVNYGRFVLRPQIKQTCEFPKRLKRAAPNLPSYYATYNDGKIRYVELALIADYSMYEKYGRNETMVYDRLHSIANRVNSLYHPLHVRINLVYTEVWKDGDKFLVDWNSGETLNRFLNYRKKMLKEHPNDNAYLITNNIFDGRVAGKAIPGTICSYEYSGGVAVDSTDSTGDIAAVLAHEMGHNFGMHHDASYETSCSCPNGHCIMFSHAGNPPPSQWSDCSLRYLMQNFNRGMDFCLRNRPENTVGQVKCGNGIVEKGEECDPGEENSNKCCDSTTCKLLGGAKCGDGECCDLETCKPKQRSTECRPASGICDLPEYCNGETPDCPADFFIQDGHVCPGRENEYCYQGECGSRSDQCTSIWGPGSKAAAPKCFTQNAQGIFQGNCGFDVHEQKYLKCEPQDAMCGRLHCETQTERPIFGNAYNVQSAWSHVRNGETVHQCKVIKTTIAGTKKQPDPGMVIDGAQCGEDMMCIGARCKERKEVMTTVPKCEDNCNWRGICNNVGNCHCANGFGGIACEIPGFGGSLNSNHANLQRGLTPLFVFLILVGILLTGFLLVCFVYGVIRRRNLLRVIWIKSKKSLKLQGVVVPIRKAPAPPGGRNSKRQSFFSWHEARVSYTAIDDQKTPETDIPLLSASSHSPVCKTPNTIKPNHSWVFSAKSKGPLPPLPHLLDSQQPNNENHLMLTDKLPSSSQTCELNPIGPTLNVDNSSTSDNPPPPPPKEKKPMKPGVSFSPMCDNRYTVEEKMDVKKLAARFEVAANTQEVP